MLYDISEKNMTIDALVEEKERKVETIKSILYIY